MRKNQILASLAGIALIGGLAACSASAPAAAPVVHVTQTVTAKPTPTVTITAKPTPTVTKTVAPKVIYVAPPARAPELLNAQAVVTQYYADINDGDFADAWNNLGGSIIAGPDYNGWVAGFDTTASISLSSWGYFGSDQVTVILTSVQTDGSVQYYTGTYTVENGEIVSASIVQN